MSRVGLMAVPIPPKVEIEIKDTFVRVKGPNGEMERQFPNNVGFVREGDEIKVTRSSDSKQDRSMHGTARALLNNMVVGVHTGFERILEINGVGYRAEVNGKTLTLNVGYSHPVDIEPPDGIAFEADARTRQIKIKGKDKQQVGQVAANIRKVRPPEPYQGKGIKYLEERIRRKAGKSAKVS
jgi:large subunit ribosomal protein L6